MILITCLFWEKSHDGGHQTKNKYYHPIATVPNSNRKLVFNTISMYDDAHGV